MPSWQPGAEGGHTTSGGETRTWDRGRSPRCRVGSAFRLDLQGPQLGRKPLGADFGGFARLALLFGLPWGVSAGQPLLLGTLARRLPGQPLLVGKSPRGCRQGLGGFAGLALLPGQGFGGDAGQVLLLGSGFGAFALLLSLHEGDEAAPV